MRTIGIRASANDVTFAVYDSVTEEIVNVELVRIPKALARPDGLKYIRNSILDVLREYDIERAGLRVTESNARQRNIQRIELEGVIQESFASSTLAAYFCGQISSISSRLGIERTEFKPLVNSAKKFDKVENWAELDREEREAVLAALGALDA